ncbi:aldo/keto reductase [Segatella copri]|uniref:Aldo/keto reductase n=4 Tax=Segatella copri TaxID=165179 RepID=A0AA92TRT2_9BACT|nr:aldo/keto reductase [Segatella copri]RGU91475.1 aldo/keto reductase [Segatella copri]
MEKEILLNNGVKIPTPGFGTFLTPDGATCVEAVKAAIAAGYTHIDTAAVYKNEKSVGEGIKESGIKRENLFVTSKVWNTERGYDKTLKAFDKTLSDLGLDYLDLYLIHWPANELQFGKDANQQNVDTWKAMERLHEEGLIRSIGLSNFMQHHAEPVMAKANICPMVDQIEYHPGFTQKECVEFCKKNNILVEAWSPLGRGNVLDNPLLKSIAASHGKSVAQVVIRWVMQTGVLPLAKSVTPSRIKENIDVFDFELSQQEMFEIASLKADRIGSDPDTCDFQYGMVWSEMLPKYIR